MGIKFDNDYIGYSIKIDGIRKKFNARDIEQAVNALRHYNNKDHDRSNCPLCDS